MEHAPLSVPELEAQVLHGLPAMVADYYRSGARGERTVAGNLDGWAKIRFRPRVLRDASVRDLRSTLFGADLDLPVIVAPMAFQGLVQPRGEVHMAAGARRSGSRMVLSTLSTSAVEAVTAAGPAWFQLYVYKDRAVTEALVQRAVHAGCGALVVTVDAPVLGVRHRDVRNGFRLPDTMSIRELLRSAGLDHLAQEGREPNGSALAEFVYGALDPSLTWEDIRWLKGIAGVPVLVKGVLRADDAKLALAAGADGVIVSNHGGRQLDDAIATADALEEVVAAVGRHAAVLVDGGIRSGRDVAKALCLGADAVLVGRPMLYGLSWRGADGVAQVFEWLRDELDEAMALLGCRTLADLSPDRVTR